MAVGRGGLSSSPYIFSDYLENQLNDLNLYGYDPSSQTAQFLLSEGAIPNVAPVNTGMLQTGTTNSNEIGDQTPANIGLLQQFNIILSKYLEGQDADDMDRVDRQNAIKEWTDALATGDMDVIKAVDVSDLEDIEGWSDYYASVIGTTDAGTGTGEDTSTGKDPSAISDEEAIAAVLASLPDKLKGIFNEQNIMKVLETVIDDPMTKIKKDMGAGVEIIFDEGTTWEDWKVFGPLAIPGVPLPPGIIDVTLGDIADAAESVGGSISEIVNGILTKPDETIKKIGTEILSTVRGVFEGTKDDPGFGGTLGTFKDWVLTTMGGGLGGLIFTTISNEASTIFGGDTGATPPIPGGTPPDEEPTPKPKQGDDIADFGGSRTAIERPPPDDIFVDTTDDPDTNELLFGGRRQADVVDSRRDLILPGGDDDRRKPDPVITDIGTGRKAVDRDQDPFIPDPEPPKPDPIVIGGNIEEDPDTTEIGGPAPTPTPSGGGGSVGGGTGTADPFIRAIEYTPTVPVALQQQAPVDYASGLMSPNTSMDAIGQLIFRNLA